MRDARTYTPKHLADKILQAKSAIEGERKQVTVLFADVKGSMDLAEQMDPEAWSAIMQGFFTILAEGVERFEGFVDKFTGDGIMALFGAPIAHEDHAQRACFAALHLRDDLKRYADELRRSRGIEQVIGVVADAGTGKSRLCFEFAEHCRAAGMRVMARWLYAGMGAIAQVERLAKEID